MNIKLKIAYDGTNYLGWQMTNSGPSIEESLQTVLEKILQHKVSLQAASRTDAGVHANGQVVNFQSAKENVCLNRLKASLNGLLPKDIIVLEVEAADKSFHPTLNCIKKEYHYHLCYGAVQLPVYRLYSWHFPKFLNLQIMRSACLQFIGEHDFSAFCNMRKYQSYTDYSRCIHGLEIDELPNSRLCVRIIGNNFLYNMARNLVGTLAYVGCGKIALQSVDKIITGRDRTQAGITAPAHGLSLHKAIY